MFDILAPWGRARFGAFTLKKGWWKLVCAGPADVYGLEVKLSCSSDPLIVFPGDDAAGVRVFLRGDEPYEVSLLVSAWPGAYRFEALKLVRLHPAEEAKFLAQGFGRLASAEKPFQRIAGVASRLLFGRSVGVRVNKSAPSAVAPDRPLSSGGERLALSPTLHKSANGVVAITDANDTLHPRAFELVAAEFERPAGAQVVYCDVREGGLIRPKPKWDAELAGRFNFVGLPVFFRTAQAPSAGEVWETLRSLAAAHGGDAISRIPLPLVDRADPPMRPLPAVPTPALKNRPRVSAIIPTKFAGDLLRNCLVGLAQRTGYPDIEAIIVNNGNDSEVEHRLASYESDFPNLKVVDGAGPFNFSRLINLGQKQATGEVILLLNDDVEPIEEGWLDRMIEPLQAPDVGAVGVRLVYPDRTVQHAGVMMGLGGVCGHLWKHATPEEAAQNYHVSLPGERMAVTGACLATRRDAFEAVGGLDEDAFPIAFNDIDYCLRLRQSGRRIIYRGDAVLIHHESKSRGPDSASAQSRKRLAAETKRFFERWRGLLDDDPYGSPAFDPAHENGAVRPVLTR